ncbi:MAG: hypothetical protein IE891_00850 [Flavobacteriaceae bacterium]|nr:hypothetical protein [Flavobacteriaceae bacterium]
MKKFIFSAVALVAFSFAGVANNEVKEEKVQVKETVKADPCIEWAIGALGELEAAMGCEFSDVESGAILLALTKYC